MTRDEYNMLCKRVREEYEIEVQRATARLEAKLRALAVVRDLSERRDTPNAGISTAGNQNNLHEMVRDAIQAIEGDATLQTVMAWVEAANPDLRDTIKPKSVSTALRRLAENGVLEVVDQGSGRRPTTYRKRTS